MPPAAPRKRLCRAVLVVAGAGYLAFLLLFELPSLPFSSPSSPSSSLTTHRSRRRELEASAFPSSRFSPSRPAFPAAVSPSPSSPPPLPIFSSLLVLRRSNATATPFDGAAADAFSAARPHLAHLQAAASASATSASPSPPPSSPICPQSISLHADKLPADGVRTVELPCGLAVGSHVTVVARPRPARPEYDPKIAQRKDGGKTPLMVSQFMVELVGTKVVDGEAPPRILHFNPRIRGDYSGKPVIEMNSCYRMQWARSHRCEGFASRPAEETVDGQLKCEKWIRDDDNKSEESKMKWWVKRLIGRSKDVHISWPYPFAEGKLFVLTLTAGLEGYHVNVDGRHVTSFPYRTGYTLEDATGLSINGDIDIESIFASSLPSSHPSFSPERYLEMSEQWRAPPLPTEPVELFIGILSAASHFAERMAVRKSWMMYTRKSSNIVARGRRARLAAPPHAALPRLPRLNGPHRHLPRPSFPCSAEGVEPGGCRNGRSAIRWPGDLVHRRPLPRQLGRIRGRRRWQRLAARFNAPEAAVPEDAGRGERRPLLPGAVPLRRQAGEHNPAGRGGVPQRAPFFSLGSQGGAVPRPHPHPGVLPLLLPCRLLHPGADGPAVPEQVESCF